MGLLITTYANLVNVWKTSGEAGKQRVNSFITICDYNEEYDDDDGKKKEDTQPNFKHAGHITRNNCEYVCIK